MLKQIQSTSLAVVMLAMVIPSCGGKVVFDDSARGGAGANSSRGGGGAGGGTSVTGGSGGAGGVVAAGGCGGGLVWAHSFGSSGEDRVEELANAGGGRTVVVGGISGAAQVANTAMSTAGGMDAYVFVLDDSGEVEWARTFGDGSDQLATSVAVDPAGTIYVAGYTEGVVDFGNGPLPSAGASDVFIIALTPDGETQWSRVFGSIDRDVGEDVAVSPSGAIYLGGSVSWSLQVGNDSLVHSGATDALLVKLSKDGQPEWAKLFGGAEYQTISSVASDGQGDVIATGQTAGDISFGGPSLPFDDKADAFVAKLDPSGAHLWSNIYTGAGFQEGYGIATDSQDSIVITGLYEGTVSFGGEPLVSLGARDIYLAKLDAAGQQLWSRSFGDTGIQSVRHVATSSDDSILLTGPASSDVDFGCGRVGGASGSPKAAVSKFDPAGNLTFGVIYDDANGEPGEHQYAHSAVSDGGDLVSGGVFYVGISLGGQTAQSNGHTDCFITKHVGVP